MISRKASSVISKFSKKELDSFFKHAKRVYKDQAFTILMHPKQHEFARVLVVASCKYGNAPQRNLIKRRIKSIFREEKLYEKQHSVAFIVRPEAKKYSFNDLKKLCLKIFSIFWSRLHLSFYNWLHRVCCYSIKRS